MGKAPGREEEARRWVRGEEGATWIVTWAGLVSMKLGWFGGGCWVVLLGIVLDRGGELTRGVDDVHGVAMSLPTSIAVTFSSF